MIGDGLSHVGFGTLAVASVLNIAPLWFTLAVTVVCAFLLLQTGEHTKISGDASVAMLSAGSLAIGVTVVSLSGENSDVNSYLFGSILAISKSDVILSVILAVCVLVMYAVFYHKIFAITFDETFARSGGIKTKFYNSISALMVAVTVVLGMRMLGALLISSLLIFPPLTAMRICKTWRNLTISSAILAVVCFLVGVVLSIAFSLPTGASVVLVNLAVYLIVRLCKR